MKTIVRVPRVAAKEDPSPPVSFHRRPERMDGLRLGFLDNTKPNSDRFLNEISRLFQGKYRLDSVRHRRKYDSSSPASPELLEEFKHNCDVVVNAVPD